MAMDAELWWLWVLRMLVGVGLVLGGYWLGKTYGRGPGGTATWTLDDLRSVRRKIQEAGPLAFVELTPAEMAAYTEVVRIMMADGYHAPGARRAGNGRIH